MDSDTAVFLRLVRFLYRKVSGPAHVSYISLFVAKKNVKTKTNKKGKKHRVPFFYSLRVIAFGFNYGEFVTLQHCRNSK